MSYTITPIAKPGFLLLHRALPSLLSPRHVRIRPDGLDDFVFLPAGEDLDDVGEEAVHLVRRVDYHPVVCEGEGDGDVPAVGGAGD